MFLLPTTEVRRIILVDNEHSSAMAFIKGSVFAMASSRCDSCSAVVVVTVVRKDGPYAVGGSVDVSEWGRVGG